VVEGVSGQDSRADSGCHHDLPLPPLPRVHVRAAVPPPKAHPASAHQIVPSLSSQPTQTPYLSPQHSTAQHSTALLPIPHFCASRLQCQSVPWCHGCLTNSTTPSTHPPTHSPLCSSQCQSGPQHSWCPQQIPLYTVQPHVLAMAILARDTILASIAGWT
jgi:hypothetical protein